MSKPKPKTVTKHADHPKKAGPTQDIPAVHVSAPSPEVSAPARDLATSSVALAPAIAAVAALPVMPPVTPPGDLPPATATPTPPSGWEPTPKKKRGPRGLRPKAVQIASAVAVAKELTGSATYQADFGSRAPSAAQVAFVVTNAAKWRATWAAAKKFYAYAAEQRATWENEALVHMDKLKPAFEYVTARDPVVAEKYSATSKYLGATNAIAARAATVRKANEKAKKGGAAALPAAAATATPAATEPTAK
jgi:hypothetical protein